MDAVFDAVIHAREHGTESVLVTVVEAVGSTPARAGAKMLVRAEGAPVGTVGGGALEKAAGARARRLIGERRGELVRYSLTEESALEGAVPTGMLCGGNATLYFDYLGLGEQVFIFGGGHVGAALARVLADLPYYVTVIDHRSEVAAAQQHADRVIVGEYATALDNASVAPGGYYIIATPSHAFDYEVLHKIMASDWAPAYVGMLGSAAKSRGFLQRLYDELGDDAPWDALYSPVGLKIGGPTPAEIAISIVSEMQAVRYGQAEHRHMRFGKPESATAQER